MLFRSIGILIAYGTDKLRKHMKKTLVILLALEASFFTWLTLLCSGILPFSYWQLYLSSVFGASFAFSLAPLFFEYTVELMYPIPECLVGSFLTFFYNFIGVIFLCTFFIPNVGELWMNYVLVGAALGKHLSKSDAKKFKCQFPPVHTISTFSILVVYTSPLFVF